VSAADVARVEQRIRSINRSAKMFRTQSAQLPIDKVLNVGAFDLERALAVDRRFLEPEYPFEWAGAFTFAGGKVHIRTGEGGHAHAHHDHDHHHHHGDHAHGAHDPDHDHDHQHDHDGDGHDHHHDHARLGITFVRVSEASEAALDAQIELVLRAFADTETAVDVPCGGTFVPGAHLYRLDVGHAGSEFTLDVKEPGNYAVFCEHLPQEFALRFEGQQALAERQYASHHHHDDEITSIGIADERALDPKKLDEWLGYLLQSQGQDIFRMKGVLNLRGEERRYVFHGVHMMFDSKLERPWGRTPRSNSLVFIGRKLDRKEIEAGFESCVA